MKNTITFLFLIISALTFAQEDTNEQPVSLNEINKKKHEFRIDVLEALIIPAVDISYEYVLSKYSGVGASIYIANGDSFDQNFAFTGFFRQYFFNKKEYGARGLFAEGLLQYATGKTIGFTNTPTDFIETTEQWRKIGYGFSLGQKWVSRNGFVIEISAGGGRYFATENQEIAPEGFFRGGVSFGYRF